MTGTAYIAIYFEDLNDGDGVQGTISNREVWDIDGLGITATVAPTGVTLPNLRFRIGPGSLADNGSLEGGIFSTVVNSEGALVTYEDGQYYGVLSGDDAEKIIGIIVVQGADPRFGDTGREDSTVTYQETGGFMADR